MALDRNTIRTDLGYLSRRRKPAPPATVTPEPARSTAPSSPAPSSPAPSSPAPSSPAPSSPAPSSPAPSSPAPPVSAGLTLRGSRPQAAVPTNHAPSNPAPQPAAAPASRQVAGPNRAAERQSRLFPAPAMAEVRQLGAAHPLVRLNARQSAIGSLLVTGARSVAWEDRNLITGARHTDGHIAGTAVSTPGNRPLVGIDNSVGAVSLRHVKLLRRALFIAGEAPLTIAVFDGAAAALAARDEAGQRSVVYAARIGSVLELRAESVPPDASDAAIWALFGFTMTIPLDHRVQRR